MVFLLQFLRQRPDFDEEISKRPPVRHRFPFCFLPPWQNGQGFVNKCTHGVASYVMVRLLTTLVALVTAFSDKYGVGR